MLCLIFCFLSRAKLGGVGWARGNQARGECERRWQASACPAVQCTGGSREAVPVPEDWCSVRVFYVCAPLHVPMCDIETDNLWLVGPSRERENRERECDGRVSSMYLLRAEREREECARVSVWSGPVSGARTYGCAFTVENKEKDLYFSSLAPCP